jgi:hypothetical protein
MTAPMTAPTRHLSAALIASAAALAAGAASAACTAPAGDLTAAQANAVYDCLRADMQAGYAAGPKQWIPGAYVADYRGWTAASTAPAVTGPHGERFLMTFVNPVGADAYLEFKDEGALMPAGTVIAKESFSVGADRVASPGPLFFMEKVAPGRSPDTGDWFYMAVAPDGAPMAVDVVTACNVCHAAYADRDQLGYPDPNVRATR